MLTPGYSLTAPERVLPNMMLDFTTGVLDSRVTVTRALNTATRVNSSGYIEVVNANLPRFDYSPTSVGTPFGLLIEESRANLLLQSQDFSTTWTRVNANISTDVAVSPDGTSNADLFNPTATPATVIQGTTKAASSLTYTLSVYVKPSGFTTFRVFVYGAATSNRGDAIFSLVGNGSISSVISVGTFTNTTASITPAGNGYYRCTVTTTSNTDTAISVTFRYDGAASGSSGFLLYGAQLEQGAFPTSYIPTTTTSLTRNADNATMTGTNFSDWYNATQGTLYAEGSHQIAAGLNLVIAEIGDGTANNIIELYGTNNGQGNAYISSGGGAVATIAVNSTFPANVNGKVIVGFRQNDFQIAGNGALGTSDTSGNMPVSPTALYIGRYGGNAAYWNGPIRKIMYWPQRLTNAELQAFSK